MAKTGTPSGPRKAVTAERAGRLARLLTLLGQKPQSRDNLLRSLELDLRGFYRDLQLLRDIGVHIDLEEGRYVLTEPLDAALARLPFPDPGLNLTEAILLSEGTTPAHRKLRKLIEQFTGRKTRSRPKSPRE